MSFNPNEHLRKLGTGDKAQDYLDVKWRLVWFRETYPQGRIDTEELAYDLDREVEAEGFAWNPETRRSEKIIKKARGYARYRAIVEDGLGGRATGTKSENAANFADFGEKAETGAIGRALAGLGFGTQFAPELNEEHRIVDSPVDRQPDAGQKTPSETKQAPQSSNARDGQVSHSQAISVILDEYQGAFPERCREDKWKYLIVREALGLRDGEKLPKAEDYQAAHVYKVRTYIDGKKRQQKAS